MRSYRIVNPFSSRLVQHDRANKLTHTRSQPRAINLASMATSRMMQHKFHLQDNMFWLCAGILRFFSPVAFESNCSENRKNKYVCEENENFIGGSGVDHKLSNLTPISALSTSTLFFFTNTFLRWYFYIFSVNPQNSRARKPRRNI